jgi:hypothetical protein
MINIYNFVPMPQRDPNPIHDIIKCWQFLTRLSNLTRIQYKIIDQIRTKEYDPL